jgi:hypothetical protein
VTVEWVWIEHPLIPESRTRVTSDAFALVYAPKGYVLDTDQTEGGETLDNSLFDTTVATLVSDTGSETRSALAALGLATPGVVVTKINGEGPDGTGNVTLSAADVGAAPAGTYATTVDVTAAINAATVDKVDNDDSRLTDARTPLPHSHPVDEIDATGSPTSGTFLRGDGTWAIPAGDLGSGGVTDHGALTGLGDDDHPQYLTEVRGDVRYYDKAAIDLVLDTKSDNGHTHPASEISDATAVGIAVLTAANAAAARTALEISSQVDIAAELANIPIFLNYQVGSIPLRPNTTASGRWVRWRGPAAANLPTTGTSAGGTSAAAPGDEIVEY